MVKGHLDYLSHHNWQEKHDTSAAQSKHEPHYTKTDEGDRAQMITGTET